MHTYRTFGQTDNISKPHGCAAAATAQRSYIRHFLAATPLYSRKLGSKFYWVLVNRSETVLGEMFHSKVVTVVKMKKIGLKVL